MQAPVFLVFQCLEGSGSFTIPDTVLEGSDTVFFWRTGTVIYTDSHGIRIKGAGVLVLFLWTAQARAMVNPTRHGSSRIAELNGIETLLFRMALVTAYPTSHNNNVTDLNDILIFPAILCMERVIRCVWTFPSFVEVRLQVVNTGQLCDSVKLQTCVTFLYATDL